MNANNIVDMSGIFFCCAGTYWKRCNEVYDITYFLLDKKLFELFVNENPYTNYCKIWFEMEIKEKEIFYNQMVSLGKWNVKWSDFPDDDDYEYGECPDCYAILLNYYDELQKGSELYDFIN